MEVDVSSSLRDSTSDQIIEVKIERENHKSGKEKKVPACGMNRSDDDKEAGESCVIEEDKLNPAEVGNLEEVNYKSRMKKQGSVHENDDPDDENISGENCMANGTKLISGEDKCSGEVQCKIRRVSPGKRKREALYLNDQSKSINEDVAEVNQVSAAEIGSNMSSGSTVDNCPSLVGGAVADSCTELQGTKRTRSNKDKEHSCTDTDKVDRGNKLSALETVCESNSKILSSKKCVSTEEVSLTENSADLGGTVADDCTGLPGGSTAETDTILQYQRRKKNNSRERQTISDCNVHEPSNIASTFDSECRASSNNCISKDATVTEESSVMETGTQGENKKKRMKSKEEDEQKSSLSTPIRSATEIIHVTRSVTTDNVEPGSSCTSDILVLKDLVPPGKKKLLILDINGLLADINQDYNYAEYADFTISSKLVFKRPFCTEFLNFCFANFEIGVWSSRNKYNVQKAVQYLMGDLRNKLLFCWDQSKCTATNFNTIDNSRKPLVFKELNKVWEKEEPDLPWEKGRFTPSNTLLVDDSPYKACCNPPFTAIFPLPYSFKHKEDNSLGIGGDLRVYLEKVAMAGHVQYFVKDNPFGQPAITDSHPNWKFYLRIIENLDKPLVSA